MIDFSIGKKDLYIKLFPIFIYANISSYLIIEFGFLNVCLTLHLGYDSSAWDD